MATAAKLLPITLARTMRADEPVPIHIPEPFLAMPSLDREWVWVSECDDKVIGCLIAVPCHGTALILCVHMLDDAPPIALRVLLHQFFADLRTRGVAGYVTWFDESSDTEMALRRITEKLGGVVVDRVGVGMSARIPREDM